MADGKPLEKRKGSRASRKNGAKTRAAQLAARAYYRDCLTRRKDKTKGA